MNRQFYLAAGTCLLGCGCVFGCAKHRASVTAVPLSPWNQCEPEGIPYYLPKPLLVVAKNVRHIDESRVGLTYPAPIPNGFDNQAAYGDIKANVTNPGDSATAAANTGTEAMTAQFDTNKSELPEIWEKVSPSATIQDGLKPEYFFTYQIIFVPDLTQKYGLRVKGGPGEIRAAMNLVNGWMYTGMGPFYMKDSSTAQNFMAAGVGAMYAGRGAAQVLNELAGLSRGGGAGGAAESAPYTDGAEFADRVERIAKALQQEKLVQEPISNYAEIRIFEPVLHDDGTTSWELVIEQSFDRQYFSKELDAGGKQILREYLNGLTRAEEVQSTKEDKDKAAAALAAATESKKAASGGKAESAEFGPALQSADALMDQIEARVFDLPPPTLSDAGPDTEVNVNVGDVAAPQSKKHRLFHRAPPPTIGNRAKRYFNELPRPTSTGGPGRAVMTPSDPSKDTPPTALPDNDEPGSSISSGTGSGS